MAIVTQPRQVGNIIIFSILIYMMNSENSFICFSANNTHLHTTIFPHNLAVGKFSKFPIRMSNPDKFTIPPFDTAFFTAKKFSGYRFVYISSFFVSLFTAKKTDFPFSFSQGKMVADVRAKFTLTFGDPGGF